MRFRTVPILLGLLALAAGFGTGQVPPAQGENDGVEVLARGPVHEAFADPLTDQQIAGILMWAVGDLVFLGAIILAAGAWLRIEGGRVVA